MARHSSERPHRGMRPGEPNRAANAWTAKFVPLFLLAIIGYATWVATGPVCVDYLLNPAPSTQTRRQVGPAVAILVIFYLLLIILLVCYARLIQTIVQHPGLVPRGPQWFAEEARKHRRRLSHAAGSRKEESLDADSMDSYVKSEARSTTGSHEHGHRVQDFWQKDVFVAGYDGRPPFCSTCYNYKPDRAHHCRELDRCVLKMDHFCPWVGGIISETSFKYFIQFTFWAALFCLHSLVFTAYYFAQRRSRESFVNVHWILLLVFAALFFFFSAGMCGSSLQFAFLNSNTIENLSRKSKVWYLCVYIPDHVLEKMHVSGRNDLRTITYPRPPSEQLQILQQSGANVSQSDQSLPQAPSIAPPHPAVSVGRPGRSNMASHTPFVPPSNARTFAILETKPGHNPFDIGALNNFKEVMGHTLFDWLFPIRPSPLTKHDDPESMYRVGRVVYQLKKDAGLLDENDKRRHSSRRKRKRHGVHAERRELHSSIGEGNV